MATGKEVVEEVLKTLLDTGKKVSKGIATKAGEAKRISALKLQRAKIARKKIKTFNELGRAIMGLTQQKSKKCHSIS